MQRCSVVILLLIPGFAQAANPSEAARVFIVGLADTAIAALTPADISREERQARARVLLRANFATQSIAQFVLGRYWRNATPAEREEFITLFEDLVVATYADRFSRYTGQKLTVLGAATDGESGDTIVNSQVQRAAGSPVRVDWRVRSEGDQLKVVDVIIEGVSMSQTQRAEFASVIRNKGGTLAGLLDEIRRRVRGQG
jgi:phospholipid transport system substrate-binding protein